MQRIVRNPSSRADRAGFTRRRVLRVIGLSAAAGSLMPRAVFSQTYPTREIRIIVPFAPGGAADSAARLLAEYLREPLGHSVIVENVSGAGGNVGTASVASAPPDGHVVLMGSASNAIAVSLYRKLPFDFAADFVPVAQVADVPGVLVVNPSIPAKTVPELIQHLKSHPGAINFGSPGSGTSVHLAGEMFKQAAGIDMTHVPYRGASQALTDLITGRIQVMFPAAAAALPHAKEGNLRALAVTTARRTPLWPELPTVAEAALPGYAVGGWIGLFAPAKTPPEAVARLERAVADILARPDIRDSLMARGMEPVAGRSAELKELVRAEISRWADIIRAADIKVN